MYRAGHDFLLDVAKAIYWLLRNQPWLILQTEAILESWELPDIVDGRLYFCCLNHSGSLLKDTSKDVRSAYSDICDDLGLGRTNDMNNLPQTSEPSALENQENHPDPIRLVLPFTNRVFDEHLASVHLDVGEPMTMNLPSTRHIFQDLTHWHSRKQIRPKTGQVSDKKALRKDQRHMAEMIVYAASLTNASGKMLDPEVITVNSSSTKVSSNKKNDVKQNPQPGRETSLKPPKKGGVEPKTKREKLHEEISAKSSAKAVEEDKKTLKAWEVKRSQFDAENNPETVEMGVKAYANDLTATKFRVLHNEILLYRIRNLLRVWTDMQSQDTQESWELLALIVHLLAELSEDSLTAAQCSCCTDIVKALDVPLNFKIGDTAKRLLSFHMRTDNIPRRPSMPWRHFLLRFYGP